MLSKWLLSYEPKKFFEFGDENKTVISSKLTEWLPARDGRLGFVKEAYANYKPLELGDWKTMGYEKGEEVS